MTRQFKWTNRSVVAFAGGQDPVARIEAKARTLALNAMDEGWTGPPFDPLALAQWLDLRIEARGDIADARMVPSPCGAVLGLATAERPLAGRVDAHEQQGLTLR